MYGWWDRIDFRESGRGHTAGEAASHTWETGSFASGRRGADHCTCGGPDVHARARWGPPELYYEIVYGTEWYAVLPLYPRYERAGRSRVRLHGVLGSLPPLTNM